MVGRVQAVKTSLLKLILPFLLIVPNIAVAKPCGDGYIRDDYECHQGGGGSGGSNNSTPIIVGAVGLALVTGVILYFASSEKHPVRDTVVYQTELNQYNAWATGQAALLKGFVTAHCACNEAKEFTTPECTQAADWVLTIGARAAWHKEMSLFLSGVTKSRPSETPPEIPTNSTLCPANGDSK